MSRRLCARARGQSVAQGRTAVTSFVFHRARHFYAFVASVIRRGPLGGFLFYSSILSLRRSVCATHSLFDSNAATIRLRNALSDASLASQPCRAGCARGRSVSRPRTHCRYVVHFPSRPSFLCDRGVRYPPGTSQRISIFILQFFRCDDLFAQRTLFSGLMFTVRGRGRFELPFTAPGRAALTV